MSAALPFTGLADAVIDSQAHFHSVMNALARPGSIEPLATPIQAPAPLSPGLAALALTLADHEAPIWLDATLGASRDVADYLRFHTGARIVADPSAAAFALVADLGGMPPLADFAQGSDDYPDRSTTILIAVETLASDGRLTLSGPGIRDVSRLSVDPWPAGLTAQWAANRAQFPRGVDLVFVAAGQVAALPRTTLVLEA